MLIGFIRVTRWYDLPRPQLAVVHMQLIIDARQKETLFRMANVSVDLQAVCMT